MELSPHYLTDLQIYFSDHNTELTLYEALYQALDALFPRAQVKVQKSQISFYGRHLFAAASLPIRRRKGWPEHCLMVTFGLGHQLTSPRIAASTEPYPHRWTHHVLLSCPSQIDSQLLGWLNDAWIFAEGK